MNERRQSSAELYPALGEGLRRAYQACASDAATRRFERIAEQLEAVLQQDVRGTGESRGPRR